LIKDFFFFEQIFFGQNVKDKPDKLIQPLQFFTDAKPLNDKATPFLLPRFSFGLSKGKEAQKTRFFIISEWFSLKLK